MEDQEVCSFCASSNVMFLSLDRTQKCTSCVNDGSVCVLNLGPDFAIMSIVLFIPKIVGFFLLTCTPKGWMKFWKLNLHIWK